MARERDTAKMAFLLLAVFICSVFVTATGRAVLPGILPIGENTDYIEFYRPVAKNILTGQGFIRGDGAIAIRYPPGYPLILAGLFGLSGLLSIPEGVVLTVFILLCVGLTSMFIFLLARSIWGIWLGLIPALVWTTSPLVLRLALQPNSEIPFLVFFYGSFCLFWYGLIRKSHTWYIYFISGVLMGMAMLVRPIAIGAGLVMGAILWLTARQVSARLRLLLTTMLLLGNFLVVFPWQAWVYSRTGRVICLSTGGVAGIQDGLTFSVAPKEWRKGVKLPEDVTALMRDVRSHYDHLQSFGDIISFMAKRLQSQPLTVAKLFLIKAARSWYGTDSQRFENLILLLQIFYLIMVLWGTITAWKLGGTIRQLTISIWSMVLYFWAMTILSLSILRYMVPAMGLLFILIPSPFLKTTAFMSKANPKAV